MSARARVAAVSGATALVTSRAMTGVVRKDDRRTVDVDDETLAAIHAAGGKVFVVDSLDGYTSGQLVHDGTIYVIRLDTCIERDAKRTVKIKPRLALGARP